MQCEKLESRTCCFVWYIRCEILCDKPSKESTNICKFCAYGLREINLSHRQFHTTILKPEIKFISQHPVRDFDRFDFV